MSSNPRTKPSANGDGALVLPPDAAVTCPHCQGEFSLADGFASRSLEQMRSASEQRLAELRRTVLDGEAERLKRERADGEAQVAELKRLLVERDERHAAMLREMRAVERNSAAAELQSLKESIGERDARIAALIERQAQLDARARELVSKESEFASRVEQAAREVAGRLAQDERAASEAALAAARAQTSELRERELALLKERAQLQELQSAAETEAARRVEIARQLAETNARETESARWKLREAELQKKLDDMSATAEELRRQSEQGSQQLQGEVLELVLEEELRAAFPHDAIEEVKKGARGGDLIQRVASRSGQPAGIILWEAKRAQNFSREWCAKLREDQRALGAEVGVIVSHALPKELTGQPFGLYEEVWVTTPAAALALAKVLCVALQDVHKQRVVSSNRGEKMAAVYDYVTSPQFAHKIRAVYGALRRLRDELDSERTQTMQRWNRREKQIQQAVLELAGVGGDLQGLAQQELPQLEIEPGDADDGQDSSSSRAAPEA